MSLKIKRKKNPAEIFLGMVLSIQNNFGKTEMQNVPIENRRSIYLFSLNYFYQYIVNFSIDFIFIE